MRLLLYIGLIFSKRNFFILSSIILISIWSYNFFLYFQTKHLIQKVAKIKYELSYFTDMHVKTKSNVERMLEGLEIFSKVTANNIAISTIEFKSISDSSASLSLSLRSLDTPAINLYLNRLHNIQIKNKIKWLEILSLDIGELGQKKDSMSNVSPNLPFVLQFLQQRQKQYENSQNAKSLAKANNKQKEEELFAPKIEGLIKMRIDL